MCDYNNDDDDDDRQFNLVAYTILVVISPSLQHNVTSTLT